MAAFVYINGYPGVGKLTIAKELTKLIPRSKIFNNHLLIDPVAALFNREMKEYQPLRRELRCACLSAISTSTSTADITWIFTDASSPTEAASALDYQKAAITRGSPFFSIVLECDLEENLCRVKDGGRGGETNTKLTDVDIVRSIRETEKIYRFRDELELELDITLLSPVEAAQRILEHVTSLSLKE